MPPKGKGGKNKPPPVPPAPLADLRLAHLLLFAEDDVEEPLLPLPRVGDVAMETRIKLALPPGARTVTLRVRGRAIIFFPPPCFFRLHR